MTPRQSLLFVAVGVALLGVALLGFVAPYELERRAIVAEGTVTQLNHGRHHVEVAFVAAHGERISYSQGGVDLGVGDPVRVYYDADDPQHTAGVDRPILRNWVGVLVPGLFGIVLLVVSRSKRA